MFRGLRLRLTALYLATGFLLLVLVGVTAYSVVRRAFDAATDHALTERMAHEFAERGLAAPAELRTLAARPVPGTPGARDGDVHYEGYDAELAAIFVLPLDAKGTLLPTASPAVPAGLPDRDAAQAALAQGRDLRTVRLAGRPVRLLSYRAAGSNGLAALQLGRTLSDQDRTLRQLLLGLLVLGAAVVAALGAGSWALAGRSIRPAEDAWARQQTFVANASHELRTPLTLLRASAEVAQGHMPRDDADGQELLDDVLGEADHLAKLVADLLLLSRLDARALPLARERVALAEFLRETARQVGRLADTRGVRLLLEPPPDAGLTLEADPERLRQVLLILLDNAIGHTPAGGAVRLGARRAGKAVCLAVADTGDGIPPEALPHLFERFYRVDAARTGAAAGRDGSGLGLSIAKGLVEAHGGTIAVASRPGAGTCVTLSLPIGAA